MLDLDQQGCEAMMAPQRPDSDRTGRNVGQCHDDAALSSTSKKPLTLSSGGRGVAVGVSVMSSSGAVMRRKSMSLGLEG